MSANRTTSAYAENTISRAGTLRMGVNYLRVRGEYTSAITSVALSMELPPRTRRIPAIQHDSPTNAGTTSAYAENTIVQTIEQPFDRNYLRVRGEYASLPWGDGHQKELPPRARRILTFQLFRHPFAGTTSACAENTESLSCPRWWWGNYLRVRGEYKSISATIVPK